MLSNVIFELLSRTIRVADANISIQGFDFVPARRRRFKASERNAVSRSRSIALRSVPLSDWHGGQDLSASAVRTVAAASEKGTANPKGTDSLSTGVSAILVNTTPKESRMKHTAYTIKHLQRISPRVSLHRQFRTSNMDRRLI